MLNSRVFLLSLCCLLFTACANKPLLIKKGANFHSLSLCLNFAEQIEAEEKLLYLNTLNTFIEEYNAQNKKIKVNGCRNSPTQKLTITIQNTKWIGPNKQALYVTISVVGIAYFLSGGGFGFAWFAMNGTNLQMQLSPDLGGEHQPVHRYFSSWPYFNKIGTLKIKHMTKFKVFMFESLDDIEKNLMFS